jgi:ParB-like chromosome segregation protein Spo0J
VKIECTYDRLVAPGDLTPAKSNPRKHGKEQLRLLEKNIRELGWRYPVVVSKRSGRIVAGHARWEVATRMGLTEIPVDDQDFASDAEELAAIIAGDKLAELAEVDAPMLRDLLGAIDTSDIDLELTGFTECEIAGLTGGPSAEVTEDEVPEPPAVPVTCPGAVWLLGGYTMELDPAYCDVIVARWEALTGEKAVLEDAS